MGDLTTKQHIIAIVILALILGPLFTYLASWIIIGTMPHMQPGYIGWFLGFLPFGFVIAFVVAPIIWLIATGTAGIR